MMDAGELLTQAEDELTAAKEALKSKNFDWVISRAQLSILSVLKALILYKGNYYRSHSIGGLLNEVLQTTIIPNEIHMAAASVNSNYPMPSEKICRLIVQQTDAVMNWAQKEMGW